jgi:predicted nucleotidyltransferase
LDTLRQHYSELAAFGVRRIGLFGSYARGEATPESDMDILVEMDAPTFRSYTGLWSFLESLFGCEVDLVLSDTVKSRLRPHILGEVQYAS